MVAHGHTHLNRWIVLLLLLILFAVVLYSRKRRTVYSNPQPSTLRRDLSKESPLLSLKVSGVAIQLGWLKSTSYGWPTGGLIFNLYDEGITTGIKENIVQLSYDDIDYASKGRNTLYIYTKLKTPASMTISTKQVDSAITYLVSKGVTIR